MGPGGGGTDGDKEGEEEEEREGEGKISPIWWRHRSLRGHCPKVKNDLFDTCFTVKSSQALNLIVSHNSSHNIMKCQLIDNLHIHVCDASFRNH